jgi:hypothetical protein
MRNTLRSAGAVAVFVLASFTVSGCNNPADVEPGYQAPALSTQETPCPTMMEICTSITNEIEGTCPRTFPPRNWGEENSCRRTLLAQLLDSYKDCLTGNQLSDVRDCVAAQLGLPDAGDQKGADPHQM